METQAQKEKRHLSFVYTPLCLFRHLKNYSGEFMETFRCKCASAFTLLRLFIVIPQFNTVDDVLPKYVATWSYR